MDYLLLQILLFLILAAVVGFFIGWVTHGFGFESRLIASENQWRAKHHVLHSENKRLQSELDELILEKNKSPGEIPENESIPSLPFKSTEESLQLSSTDSDQNHPLERLRSELTRIEESHTEENPVAVNKTVEGSVAGIPPASFDHPQGEADDLKSISGIGPKIETTLNNLGVYHFSQIANFSEENINWVNEHLQFKGRIEREKWVAQAKELVNKYDA